MIPTSIFLYIHIWITKTLDKFLGGEKNVDEKNGLWPKLNTQNQPNLKTTGMGNGSTYVHNTGRAYQDHAPFNKL
jgi:hypothetical protein